ncbi:NAD-dependent epimerase/dehydratase family protein [Candidatus Woesearchaeota archaeon]|nr:NAD-dependent epimerase/dehydratase family protein [Candidatus Woesearchaeota archaeon]
MKAFVTGGSGFMGLSLANKLLSQGHKVKILDLKEPEIKHKNLEFVKKSVVNEIKDDIKGSDILFHFAALLGVENSDKMPLETMRINLEGSVNVFKSAMEANVKDIIFSSSSEVYGNPRELPIKEDSVKGPISTYGVSKLAAEIYAKAYNHECGSSIKIARFFNVYGPRQSNNFVVPIFIDNALQNKPIKVFGNGSQTRCFTYVDDAIDGIFKVVEKGKTGEAYNIGNNHPTTILQLAETIKELANSKSEIIKVDFGKNTRTKEREIDYRIPDISKMNALGWEPRIRIVEGIKKILEWKRNN